MFMVVFVVLIAILGAVMGSFSCCQVCRIHWKEEKKKDLGRRSVCVKCRKQLKWYDNIPILSWLLLKGKCRYCGKKIGKTEIVSEVLGAASFGVVGLWFSGKYFSQFFELGLVGAPRFWTFAWFGVLLIFMTVLMILAIYDALYGRLPIKILYIGIVVGIVFMVVRAISLGFTAVDFMSTGEGVFEFSGINWKEFIVQRGLAILLLAGPYFVLYKVSHEKLVGSGDYLVCLMIGMVLGDWWLGLWELFLANFIGAIIMLPRKQKRTAFVPFLALAFVIVVASSTFLKKLQLGMF